mgnify:CR=1 FL=1
MYLIQDLVLSVQKDISVEVKEWQQWQLLMNVMQDLYVLKVQLYLIQEMELQEIFVLLVVIVQKDVAPQLI